MGGAWLVPGEAALVIVLQTGFPAVETGVDPEGGICNTEILPVLDPWNLILPRQKGIARDAILILLQECTRFN